MTIEKTTWHRDHLGITSLYYIKCDDGYHFSSHISELLSLPNVQKKPNIRSMRTMMQGFAVNYHDTMYEGIYRLPPGYSMMINSDGEKQIERYWFPEKIKINYNISEDEAIEKLKELFEKAVYESISTLEKTAFELSGGLDSSSVLSVLAQKEDASNIDSYSMDFRALKCDEGTYVDALLAEYPVHHQKIAVATLDYKEKYGLAHLYTLSPHWPIGLTFAMFLPMLEQMKKDGKTVVVSGQGGDHLFTGSPYVLYDLFVRGKVVDFYSELMSHHQPWKAFKAYVLAPLLGEKGVRRLKRLLGKKEKIKSFWDECEVVDLTEQEGIKNPAFKNTLDVVTTALHCTVMDGNIFHCAEEYFGITYHHPFFDKDLVEFALSLPPEMKYSNRIIKRIFRKAMKGVLPEKIRLRKDKAEFSEILSQQIEAIDLVALLDEPYIVKLGLIEESEIEICLEKYRSGDLLYVSRLWIIVNVEYWYRYNKFKIEKR